MATCHRAGHDLDVDTDRNLGSGMGVSAKHGNIFSHEPGGYLTNGITGGSVNEVRAAPALTRFSSMPGRFQKRRKMGCNPNPLIFSKRLRQNAPKIIRRVLPKLPCPFPWVFCRFEIGDGVEVMFFSKLSQLPVLEFGFDQSIGLEDERIFRLVRTSNLE